MARKKKTKTKTVEGNYILPRNMEIAGISNVYKEVLKFTEKSYDKFVLDAGEVALIDTAGIQLLIQLITAFRSTGCEVSWINDSIQIYQMAAELGVADRLDP